MQFFVFDVAFMLVFVLCVPNLSWVQTAMTQGVATCIIMCDW